MNKRQWLRSQGFTVGERGRLSQPMLDAIAASGIDFDSNVIHTSHGDVVVEKRQYKKRTGGGGKPTALPEPEWVMIDEIRRRDLPSGYVVRLPNGHTTQWSVCNKCSYSVKFCRCPRPTPPPWLHDAVTIDTLF